MKIETTVSELLSPVKSAGRAVERKSTLPILACLLFESDGDQTRVIGTDLNAFVRVTTEIKATAGSYAVPAHRLRDILQSMPSDSTVTLTVEDDNNADDTCKAILRCGRSRFLLNAFRGDQFPIPQNDTPSVSFTVAQRALKAALDLTAYSMATKDVRYYLNGLLLRCYEQIHLAATDGHRLATTVLESDNYHPLKQEVESIIPHSSVEAIRKQVTDNEDLVTIGVSDRSVSFDFGSTMLITKLLDGKFPDYVRVIPRNNDRIVIADRLLLRSALCRAGIVLNDKANGVRITLDDWKLKVNARNTDQEESEDEVEVNYTGSYYEVGFNHSYLLNALDALNCAMVKLSFGRDAVTSVLIENAENGLSEHVIMSMRL